MMIALVAAGTLLTVLLGSAMRRRDRTPDLGGWDNRDEWHATMLRIEDSIRRRERGGR